MISARKSRRSFQGPAILSSGATWLEVTCAAFLFSLLASPGISQARLMSDYEVRAAAESWVRFRTLDARPGARIARIESYTQNGMVKGYIAHIDDGGFCLCSADSRLVPVYYYSPGGTFDAADPFSQGLLDEIATMTDVLEVSGPAELGLTQGIIASRTYLWSALIAGFVPDYPEPQPGSSREPDTLVLNFSLLWDQFSPYNDQCPVVTPGSEEHCAIGCAPLDMAMTMYYWKLPTSGSGAKTWWYWYSYTNTWLEEPLATDPGIYATANWSWANPQRLEWSADGGGKLRMNGYWDGTIVGYAKQPGHGITNYNDPEFLAALDALFSQLTPDSSTHYANFGAANYDYTLMEEDLEDPPGPGDSEVAELCYNVGIAQGAGWGLFVTAWGSIGSILTHMKSYFLYDQDGYGASLSMTNVVEEIMRLRIVPLCGSGHCVMVFGYDIRDPGTPLLKIYNGWGYLGGNNGWYVADEAWPSIQTVAYQLAPTPAKFVGAENPGDGSPDDPYENIVEAVAEAPDQSTLVFKALSDNRFPGTSLTINRPLTLKGMNSAIQPQ